ACSKRSPAEPGYESARYAALKTEPLRSNSITCFRGKPMDQLDPALAQWALDQARRHGASAAEVLLVSAESLAAGVRLGEVEKLKSSRERRLGMRVFVDHASATASTAEM